MYLLTTYTCVQFINVYISLWTIAASSLSGVVLLSFIAFLVDVTVSYCCTHVTSTIYCCVISISVYHTYKILLCH